MVTIKDIEKRLEHLQCMERAGIPQTNFDLGPAMILWTKDREGNEKWEILPEWVAQLVLNDLPYQDIERAILYNSPPALAPLGVVSEWVQQRLERGGNYHE